MMISLLSFSAMANDCMSLVQTLLKSKSTLKTERNAMMNYDRPFEKVLNYRVELGEMEENTLKQSLEAIVTFRARTGEDLLGEGVPKCMDEFSSDAVNNFSILLYLFSSNGIAANTFSIFILYIDRLYLY